MNFHIEDKVFNYFPGMKIISIEFGITDSVNSERIGELLKEGWRNAAAAAGEYGNPQSHPFIKPWGERMKTVGAPRKQFPSSIEAMVRRAGKGGEPFSISPVVDFYNAISMKYLVPAGAYDTDRMNGDLHLRFSQDGDTFMSLDSQEEIAIPRGELSYADGNQIITRHYVYKQSKHAILTADSKNIILVSEILGELPADTVGTVRNAFVAEIKNCFGVDVKPVILDSGKTSMY